MGWVPLRRTRGRDGEDVIEVPVPLREAEEMLRIAAAQRRPARPPGAPLCASCTKTVLEQDPARVVWGAVDEYPQPQLPNTTYKEGWDRFFRITPTGLHYYSTDVLHGKDQWNAKSSHPFTQQTELLEDPSPEEFKDIGKDRGNFVYFGLRFPTGHEQGHGDVALLMRMRTQEQRGEWTEFLRSTLAKLTEDHNWAARTRPVEMKSVSSNRLARVADLREVAHDALANAEDDKKWAREAAAAAAAARAEHEHLLRAADRSEGVVSSAAPYTHTMARIRELQDGIGGEREAALREVMEAQEAKKRAARR
eukprot:gene43709-46137_t